MNYVAYDQNASLNVAFKIYDISTGTAVFITTIAANYMAFGAYSAQYVGASAKTYLAIGCAFTDETFTALEPFRPPTCDTYQAINGGVTYCAFAYGTYDENDSLFLRADVFNTTTGTPILSTTINLVDVFAGCYFGVFTGSYNNNYEIDIAVYTDNTYLVVDTNRAASCQSFNCFFISGLTLTLSNAILEAQSLDATLEGNCA